MGPIPGYLSMTEAAKMKRVARDVIGRHARRGSFKTVRVAGRTLIVKDTRWRAWEPDRRRQRAILSGLRAAGRSRK